MQTLHRTLAAAAVVPCKVVVACFFALAFASPAVFAASEAELLRRLEHLEQELSALKSEMKSLKAEASAMPTAAPGATADNAAPASGPDTTVGGYGEINYNRYRTDTSRSQADVRRAVVYLGHRFSDQLSFDSEIEFEHAITSRNDNGETEIEQAFLTYQLNDATRLRAGLFLMPFGFLNRTHEPSSYYGVERNDVETRIIPAVWREGGISFAARTGFGLGYEIGITTGFDVSKFDDPGKPLASVHQELQLARAHDTGVYGALDYRGVPGLTLGGALFTANTTQGNAAFRADPAQPDLGGLGGRLTLWDLHTRFQSGKLDLQGLYARGAIAQAGEINQRIAEFNNTFAQARPFLPAAFYGWYGQAAYQVWARGDVSLTPFVRYERFNTQASMPPGFAADPLNDERVLTAGLSFRLQPQVVLKADVQRYQRDSTKDRFNVGMGWQF